MDLFEKELEAGYAVVLPTETVYGLFAKALNEAAVDQVYALKQRPREKAMNLNISSEAEIRSYSKNQPRYLSKLVASFLPGSLTIILEANEKVPAWINSGLTTVGFRMPAHPKTLELIRKTGPLIGPSANLSGKASGTQCQQILKELGHGVLGLEDDSYLTGQDSTILDLSGPKARILRQGGITRSEILERVPEIPFEEEEDVT